MTYAKNISNKLQTFFWNTKLGIYDIKYYLGGGNQQYIHYMNTIHVNEVIISNQLQLFQTKLEIIVI